MGKYKPDWFDEDEYQPKVEKIKKKKKNNKTKTKHGTRRKNQSTVYENSD